MGKSEAQDSLLHMAQTNDNYPPYNRTYRDPDGVPVSGNGRGGSYSAGGRQAYGAGYGQVPPLVPPPRSDSYNNRGYVQHQDYAAGGYHQREGYAPPATPTSSRSSWIYIPSSKWQWTFLSLVVLQAIIGLTLEGYIFAKFQISLSGRQHLGPHTKTVPTYLSLFIFGFIYQLVLVYDAIRMKNTIQVIGLCLYNVGLLIEAAVQSDQIHDAVRFLSNPARYGETSISKRFWIHIQPFIIAVPCVIALFVVLMSFVAWKLYHEFAWSIYKDISADLRMKQRYLSYQIYIALLKFDFFFFLAFTVQFLVVVVQTTDIEFDLTIAAIPITIIFLFLAAYCVRKESFIGMLFVFVIFFGGLAYFLFKLVRMYDGPPDRVQDYLPARRSLTTFAVITVLCLVVTIGYAVVCTLNFNKGLKQHVSSKARHKRSGSVEMTKLYSQDAPGQLSGPGPNRMTIE